MTTNFAAASNLTMLRTTPRRPARLCAGLALAALALGAPAPARGDDSPRPPMLSASTPAVRIDLIEAVRITAGPELPIEGQKVTLRLTLRNNGPATLDLPWGIALEPGNRWWRGTARAVRPHATAVAEVVVPSAQLGADTYRLTGLADPDGVLDAPAFRGNNRVEISVPVWPVTAGPGGDRIALMETWTRPARPVAGQPYRVFLQLRNRTDAGILEVPWVVARDQAVIAASGVTSFGPNGIVVVSATCPPILQPGDLRLAATLDPENTVGEPSGARANNAGSFRTQIVDGEMDVRDIDFIAARDAGANMRMNYEVGGRTQQDPPQDDVSGGVYSDYDHVHPVWFVGPAPAGAMAIYLENINRTMTPLPAPGVPCEGWQPQPFEVVATPEMFADFELKNGWKVESVELVDCPDQEVGRTWETLSVPQRGSTRPYVRIRANVRNDGQLTVFVRIRIQGPRNTNPYR